MTEKTYEWTAWENAFGPEHEGFHDGYRTKSLLVDGTPSGSIMTQRHGTFTAFVKGKRHISHLDYEDQAVAIVEHAAGRDIPIPMGKHELLRSMRDNPRPLDERDARVLVDIANEALEDQRGMRALFRMREAQDEQLRKFSAFLPEIRGAAQWVMRNYANQDMSHKDFRVEAAQRVEEALALDPKVSE